MRRAVLFLAVAMLAGCGSSSKQSVNTATTAATAPPGKVLYAGGDWAVSLDGAHATAYHRVNGTWRPDATGAVKIAILGPRGKVASIPQAAVELRATRPLVESGIWIDGQELVVKGGGLRPERGTIYGAPVAPLAHGKHLAVAYGRTDTHATAVAWTFTV